MNECADAEFSAWFVRSLRRRGIDVSFASALESILEQGSADRLDYLIDAISTLSTAEDNVEYCHLVLSYFTNPSLCEFDDSLLLEDASTVEDASATPSSSFGSAYRMRESYSGHAGGLSSSAEDAESETQRDELLLSEGVDWAMLGYALEEQLAAANPTLQYSTEAIFTSLHMCGNDVSAAYACVKTSEAAALTVRPCRHALSGRCMRRDCMFDHDLAHIVCRYWMTVGCSLEACPFLHEFPYLDYSQGQRQHSYSLGSDCALSVDSEEAFPSLPSKQKTPADKGGAGKAAELQLTFSPRPSSGAPKAAYVTPAPSAARDKRTSITQPSDWVTSGAEVSATYTALREEARQLAIGRNKLLEEATTAYVSGSKAQAKQLSASGQEMNLRMKRCHAEAARNMFATRNSPTHIARGVIDLHGLHAEEACECVRTYLAHFRQLRLTHMTVVTGSGHHSLGVQRGVSRLLQTVLALCEELRLRHQLVADAKGFSGAVKITL